MPKVRCTSTAGLPVFHFSDLTNGSAMHRQGRRRHRFPPGTSPRASKPNTSWESFRWDEMIRDLGPPSRRSSWVISEGGGGGEGVGQPCPSGVNRILVPCLPSLTGWLHHPLVTAVGGRVRHWANAGGTPLSLEPPHDVCPAPTSRLLPVSSDLASSLGNLGSLGIGGGSC